MGLGGKHRLGQLRTRLVVVGTSAGINAERAVVPAVTINTRALDRAFSKAKAIVEFDRQATSHIPPPPADPIDISILDTGSFSASPVTPADKVELGKMKHPSIAEKVAPKKRKPEPKKPEPKKPAKKTKKK